MRLNEKARRRCDRLFYFFRYYMFIILFVTYIDTAVLLTTMCEL